MHVNYEECLAAGLNEKEVNRIARGISRYAKQAEKLGLTVFGGSSGRLDFDDKGTGSEPLVIAVLDGTYDGGCGSTNLDENGLTRGE
jgi:hypothetical protein